MDLTAWRQLALVVESRGKPERRVGCYEQLGWFSNMAAGHMFYKALLGATRLILQHGARRQEHSRAICQPIEIAYGT